MITGDFHAGAAYLLEDEFFVGFASLDVDFAPLDVGFASLDELEELDEDEELELLPSALAPFR